MPRRSPIIPRQKEECDGSRSVLKPVLAIFLCPLTATLPTYARSSALARTMRRDTSVRICCYCTSVVCTAETVCGGSDPLETSETDCPLRGHSALLAGSIVNVMGKLIGACSGLGEIQCLIDFKDSGCCIQRGRETNNLPEPHHDTEPRAALPLSTTFQETLMSIHGASTCCFSQPATMSTATQLAGGLTTSSIH